MVNVGTADLSRHDPTLSLERIQIIASLNWAAGCAGGLFYAVAGLLRGPAPSRAPHALQTLTVPVV
jgi:hypothetical protein